MDEDGGHGDGGEGGDGVFAVNEGVVGEETLQAVRDAVADT